MVKVLFSSDLHGHYDELLEALAKPDYYAWCDSGDILPNQSRRDTQRERDYQIGFFSYYAHTIMQALNGRPAIIVNGNHDRIDISKQLTEAGATVFRPNTYDCVEVCGLRWAGFRDIPFIDGEWSGEKYADELAAIMERVAVMTPQPEVLVTHCPPAGILDFGSLGNRWGNPALATYFAYRNSTIRYCLSGHTHNSGGQTLDTMDVRFFNGATRVQLLELEAK